MKKLLLICISVTLFFSCAKENVNYPYGWCWDTNYYILTDFKINCFKKTSSNLKLLSEGDTVEPKELLVKLEFSGDLIIESPRSFNPYCGEIKYFVNKIEFINTSFTSLPLVFESKPNRGEELGYKSIVLTIDTNNVQLKDTIISLKGAVYIVDKNSTYSSAIPKINVKF